MMRFGAILIVWLIALAALCASEQEQPNAGAPVVKSSAAQGDIAKVNTLLAPCPLSPQNLPRIKEEQA